MHPHSEKLLKNLVAINIVGILAGTAFYLIQGVFAGLIGFLAGLFSSAFLVRMKTRERSESAGVLKELVR